MPIRLERITTAVPWPRGLAFHDGLLIVLARGRGRGAGGPDKDVPDAAGSLFEVDPEISELVDQFPRQAGQAVSENASLLAAPDAPPFKLWDQSSKPASQDIDTDRPYATLKWDPLSRNYFVCGFSGIDAADNGPGFRKNATDAIHRYDTVTRSWYAVEAHDASVVPADVREDIRTSAIPNQYYPHAANLAIDPPPHGLLNGTDGLCVSGAHLYAVAKDNHCLAVYPLADIQADTASGAPRGEVLLQGKSVRRRGGGPTITLDGYSAVGVSSGFLYLGCRTNNVIVRFEMAESGGLRLPVEGETIATFAAGSNLIDLEFNTGGELFVATASDGNVWRVGVPNPSLPFRGESSAPYVELQSLTANSKAKAINLAFDDKDLLYVGTNNNDDPAGSADLVGTIYRVVGKQP